MCRGVADCEICGNQLTGGAYARARLKAILEMRREFEAEQAKMRESCKKCSCCPECSEYGEQREVISQLPIEDTLKWIDGKKKKPRKKKKRGQRQTAKQRAKVDQEINAFQQKLAIVPVSTPSRRLKLPDQNKQALAAFFSVLQRTNNHLLIKGTSI